MPHKGSSGPMDSSTSAVVSIDVRQDQLEDQIHDTQDSVSSIRAHQAAQASSLANLQQSVDSISAAVAHITALLAAEPRNSRSTTTTPPTTTPIPFTRPYSPSPTHRPLYSAFFSSPTPPSTIHPQPTFTYTSSVPTTSTNFPQLNTSVPPPLTTPSSHHKAFRLDLEKFYGKDPQSWLLSAERFFAYYNIPDQERVAIAGVQICGDAAHWVTWFDTRHPPSWPLFADLFLQHFGGADSGDFESELSHITQTGTLEEYVDLFTRLSCRAVDWSDSQLKYVFIEGLQDDLKHDVQAQQPVFLSDAKRLARLFNRKLQGRKTTSTPMYSRYTPPPSTSAPLPPTNSVPSATPTPTVISRRLSPAEVNDRRLRGLCFNCDERFKPGHKCAKPSIAILEAVHFDEEALEFHDCEHTSPTQPISALVSTTAPTLHSLTTTSLRSTMRLLGEIQGLPIHIFIDCGATYNFLHPRIVERLCLSVTETPPLTLFTANDQPVQTRGTTEQITVTAQGYSLTSTFRLYQIASCDLLLGAEWFETLGWFQCNFLEKILHFNINDTPYTYNVSKLVGSDDTTFQIQDNSALETVYRINNGGDEIMFGQDTTGMYRNWDRWETEEEYMDYLSVYNNIRQVPNFNIRLNFSAIPEYTAPEKVYRTCRTMGIGSRITWMFPLDAMFFYLVRLHFCEFQPEIAKIIDSTFSIFMNGQLAEQKADVIAWSGGNRRPVYKDYMISIAAGPGPNDTKLWLELQANPNDRSTTYINAILNGVEILKLNDTTGNLAGPNPDPPRVPPKSVPSCYKKHSRSLTFILAIVGGALISISTLVVLEVLVFRRHGRVQKYKRSIHGATNSTKSRGSSTLPAELCYSFSLEEIKAATQNFDEICIIGHGGFGNVYKGYLDLDGGATPVAVKRLKPESSQGAKEFKTEIEMLSQFRHRHLVPLVGYCTEKGEMILVYDYMAQGTLAGHLYHTENPPLSWEQRLQICIGAARGLRYLHGGVNGTIIHRDVKSTNILLDENLVAKVADFGLSKMGMTTNSKTHISTAVKGSFGYLDPEYYRRHQLTEKSDVYSFGVVLCEVLSARPALLHTAEANQISLAEWAKSCHDSGTLDRIVDPNLAGKIEMECLNKFVEIAMSCIHDKGSERPSMNEVVKGLEFALQLHQSWIQRNGVDGDSAKTYDSIEQSSSGYDSITCISQTIFSEINNPSGR